MNSNKLNLALNILKYVLVGIGVIACLFVFGGPNQEASEVEREAFREGLALSSAIGYTLTIITIGVAVILVFFVVQLIVNTKKSVMSIIGVIVALLVYLILWMAGTSDTSETLALRDPVDASTITTVTAGIYTVLIGVVVAGLVAVLSPLMGRMRK